MLPDELLLAVFDFYVCGADDEGRWVTLVHVCRRWRHIVFAFPHLLDLQIVCTDRTPVREMLHIWPAFPITVRVSGLSGGIPDNVVAALKHRDRVCGIYIKAGFGDGFGKLATVPVVQDPFPALTHLHLGAYDKAPIVPDSFLGGSAPRLRSLSLKNFKYPALQKLLLSATGLVSLSLSDRTYISPQTIVDCLTSLVRLEKLEIEFRPDWPYGTPRRPSRHPPPPTWHTDLRPLPVLATLAFRGEIECFDHLFTHIDTPRLEDIDMQFNNPPFFDFSRIFLFTGLKEMFEALDQAHMVVSKYRSVNVTLSSRRRTTGGKVLRLLFKGWAVWGRIQDQGCQLSPANSERMDVRDVSAMHHVENDEWLELFRFFAAVGNLYLSEALAMCVAPALQELVGGGVTEVLPALENLFIENFQRSGLMKEAIGEFVTARELSGHPVTVQSWTEEIRE